MKELWLFVKEKKKVWINVFVMYAVAGFIAVGLVNVLVYYGLMLEDVGVLEFLLRTAIIISFYLLAMAYNRKYVSAVYKTDLEYSDVSFTEVDDAVFEKEMNQFISIGELKRNINKADMICYFGGITVGMIIWTVIWHMLLSADAPAKLKPYIEGVLSV